MFLLPAIIPIILLGIAYGIWVLYRALTRRPRSEQDKQTRG